MSSESSTSSPNLKLYVRAKFTGYQRSRHAQKIQNALLLLEGVKTRAETDYYLGKRVCYIYKGVKADKNGSKFRTIWGKIRRSHGNNGMVRASFQTNLPPRAMGSTLRVMLFPSRV